MFTLWHPVLKEEMSAIRLYLQLCVAAHGFEVFSFIDHPAPAPFFTVPGSRGIQSTNKNYNNTFPDIVKHCKKKQQPEICFVLVTFRTWFLVYSSTPLRLPALTSSGFNA